MKTREIPLVEFVIQEVSMSGDARDKVRDLHNQENAIRHGQDYVKAYPEIANEKVRVVRRTVCEGRKTEKVVWPDKK